MFRLAEGKSNLFFTEFGLSPQGIFFFLWYGEYAEIITLSLDQF